MFAELNGDDSLVIVTVSGPPGSGTSTLVKRIVDNFSWKSLNGGDIFRSEAKIRGLTVGEFSDLCKEDLDVQGKFGTRGYMAPEIYQEKRYGRRPIYGR